MRYLLKKQGIVVLLTVISGLSLHAQDKLSLKQVNKRIDAAQLAIAKILVRSSIDLEGKAMISKFLKSEIDSMQIVIKNDKTLKDEQKVMALNCESYFLETLKTEIESKSIDLYEVSENQKTFIPLWETIRTEQSCSSIIGDLGIKSANLMAAVFKEYPQSSKIRDLAILKSLERNPDKIMSFLSSRPDFSLRDSLLFIFANTEPERFLISAKGARDEGLLKLIQQQNYPLIKTLVSLADEKNFKDYLPFAGLLSQNKITLAAIDEARKVPSNFFKLMVDAELINQSMIVAGSVPVYRLPLRQYLKEYAVHFYTDVINSLHEEPNEKARYFVLDDLRPQDLYFVLISSENDIYTSSYLYTYKKLMSSFRVNHYDSLFQLVNNDRYRKFLLLAGRYNTLSSLLKQMQPDIRVGIINRFMNSLEVNEGNGLEETINVAETFPGIINDNELTDLTIREINNNYLRTRNINSYHGMKLYSVLKEIFTAIKSIERGDKKGLPPELNAYFTLPHSSLRSKSGVINQLALFYGDDDGKASFNNFMGNFSDAAKWSIEKNANWVTIKSKKLYPVAIYANLPLNNDEGLDVKAQELMKAYLIEHDIRPRILIHRGHSYHLSNSIKSITNMTALAILGSCGGYKELFEIQEKSTAVQVISSKQVGSQQVNGPLIKIINEKLLEGKDIDWPEIWSELDKQLRSNKLAYDYFREYIPPYKNISLLVATLYYSGTEIRTGEEHNLSGN